jgi:hypothetical protein
MTERPILFSGPMVRAILREIDPKTQTRRPIKFDIGEPERLSNAAEARPFKADQRMRDWDPKRVVTFWRDGRPFGMMFPWEVGSRLWVRETGWERPERTPRMMRDGADTWKRYYYDADGLPQSDHEQFKEWGFKRRPSIFMPRWASRVTLEVTGVRVERLQVISSEDAEAEGVQCQPMSAKGFVDYYRALWDSLNAKRGYGWEKNPWVWVINFRRV